MTPLREGFGTWPAATLRAMRPVRHMTPRRVIAPLFLGTLLASAPSAVADDMARFAPGTVVFPFRGEAPDTALSLTIKTGAFRIDKRAVSAAEFLEFVRANPRYARSRIPKLLANESYLRNWHGDLDPGSGNVPVTMVSWHAAKAYCAYQGKRLPTTAEWERVAATAVAGAHPQAHERVILAWYSRPTSDNNPMFGTGTVHAQAVRDLHGVIWEWTSDYNAWSTAGVNSRGRIDEPDDALFCGAGASRMSPGTPYATYMRWAFRASLKPDYTVAALGFRCARDD